MKKVLCLIIAVAMISTLAISAGALTLDIPDGDGAAGSTGEVKVAGGDAEKEDAICYSLIKGIKFTFDIPDYKCSHNDEDAENECSGETVGIAYNSTPTGYKEEKFCFAEKQTVTVDLSEYAWKDGVDGAEGTGINWLGVCASAWVETSGATVQIDILGEGGKVLAAGTGCDNPDCTGTENCGKDADKEDKDKDKDKDEDKDTNSSVKGDVKGDGSKVDTGIGSVAILGGVAIIAVGAVVVSRKRK